MRGDALMLHWWFGGGGEWEWRGACFPQLVVATKGTSCLYNVSTSTRSPSLHIQHHQWMVLWLVFGWLFGCAFDSINSGPVDHKFEYPSISLWNQDYREDIEFLYSNSWVEDFVPRRPTICQFFNTYCQYHLLIWGEVGSKSYPSIIACPLVKRDQFKIKFYLPNHQFSGDRA